MSHRERVESERREILSDRSLKSLIQSRIETVGLMSSQTDTICIVVSELLRLRREFDEKR